MKIRLPATTKRQSTSHQTHTTIHRKLTIKLNHPSLQNKTTDVVIQPRYVQFQIHITKYINNALYTKQPMKHTTHKRTQ